MPDNINEDVPQTGAVESDAAPAVSESAAQVETPTKPRARLAESELESSLSDVLPLSPIGNSDPVATLGAQREKKNERRGLRRGNSGAGKAKPANASAVACVVENPAEVTETLSGTGPKPRREREPRENFSRRANVPASSSEPAPAADFGEEVKPGAGWTLKEKKERNFHHIQSNVGSNNRPKLIIEPAQIPEQEAEPSFWERLKARVLAFFKVGKKKNKKRGNKQRGGKFRNDNRGNGGKDFRYSNNRNGGRQNFNRNRPRNSNFRGNRGNGHQNNGGPKSEA